MTSILLTIVLQSAVEVDSPRKHTHKSHSCLLCCGTDITKMSKAREEPDARGSVEVALNRPRRASIGGLTAEATPFLLHNAPVYK